MIGYRGEIGALHARHLPPSFSHPITGTLSYHLIGVSHLGQCDGGFDKPSIVRSSAPKVVSPSFSSIRGSRQTTTFRKDPTHAPTAKRKGMRTRCWGMGSGIGSRGSGIG